MMEGKVPVIGISTEIDIPERVAVKRRYVDAIIQAGGIPFLLPFTNNIQVLQSAVSLIDGLLLTGGGDVSPILYGEASLPECGDCCSARDDFDYLLLRFANERRIPVLGICRGMQVINTYFGGTLYQDLSSQCPSEICHKSEDASAVARHSIRCLKDSQLFASTRKEELSILSIHHQAVKEMADGFRATAFADDGMIEAMELIPEGLIWGIQFHPELQAVEGNQAMMDLFAYFVDRVKHSRYAFTF